MVRRTTILGSPLDLVTRPELIGRILDVGGGGTIGHHNLHSLYLLDRVAALRDFYRQSDLVFVDGLPLIWLVRARGVPASAMHRHTALDWLPELLSKAARQQRKVVHLGGRSEVSERAAERLRREHPGLELSVRHGFFDTTPMSAESKVVITEINSMEPDIVLAGLGMPRQELWVLRHRQLLAARVVVTIGGTFGYLGGEQRTPPRWLGPIGLEGMYRLASHPRRLGRRYLVEPFTLVCPLARDVVSARRARARLHGGVG